MSRRLLSLGCWMMAAILPLSAMSVDAVGMLTTVGTVMVDSRYAAAGGAVFAGDVIETKAGSKAIVSSQGRTVSLGENSAVRVGGKDVELQSGAVVVATTNGVLRVDNVTISAVSAAPTKFLARKVNGTVQVLALEGTVSVNDGQQTTQVPATKGVSIGSAGRNFSWLLNDDIGILIVVAAAITAGVTLGVVNALNAKPASPAGP